MLGHDDESPLNRPRYVEVELCGIQCTQANRPRFSRFKKVSAFAFFSMLSLGGSGNDIL